MNFEFLTLPDDEQNEIVTECAARMGVPTVIVEKDFWVCWILGVLFQSSLADSLGVQRRYVAVESLRNHQPIL